MIGLLSSSTTVTQVALQTCNLTTLTPQGRGGGDSYIKLKGQAVKNVEQNVLNCTRLSWHRCGPNVVSLRVTKTKYWNNQAVSSLHRTEKLSFEVLKGEIQISTAMVQNCTFSTPVRDKHFYIALKLTSHFPLGCRAIITNCSHGVNVWQQQQQAREDQKYEFSIHVPIHTQLFTIYDFFLGQRYNQSFFVFCLRTHNFFKN